MADPSASTTAPDQQQQNNPAAAAPVSPEAALGQAMMAWDEQSRSHMQSLIKQLVDQNVQANTEKMMAEYAKQQPSQDIPANEYLMMVLQEQAKTAFDNLNKVSTPSAVDPAAVLADVAKSHRVAQGVLPFLKTVAGLASAQAKENTEKDLTIQQLKSERDMLRQHLDTFTAGGGRAPSSSTSGGSLPLPSFKPAGAQAIQQAANPIPTQWIPPGGIPLPRFNYGTPNNGGTA